ncbi:MAG: acetyl-CoA carboxylase biotin carboxylase subunit [Candidatus Aminicenantales bacterium]
MFRKILVANRGEIAVRVIRTCKEMGVQAATVYSDADRKALHVRLAAEAYDIGEAAPSESYLNVEKIIGVAKACGAEALHPGYGFLAENARLVRRCEEEGIVFIGPPSSAMEAMGQKTTSRKKMVEAGVPVIPGTLEPIPDEDALEEEVRKIGYPVLLKAVAGGGGKGLRLVRSRKDLHSAFRLAQSEALSSFDDPSVYVEKYIEEPHHIEVQILADNHGNIVHLGERECSIQRRYQKVLEETPSPFLDEETRRRMGETAVKAAAAVGYRNAGTVEFVVDADRNFFFLEMNTRLQVEHPVTEMVTGIDLVRSQIEIAAGLPLPFRQEDIRPRGHAIQCRIYAEDPDNDFMPSPGKITRLRAPSGGLGVRDDSGIYEGCEVPMEYDPLLSKLVTWGQTREEAIGRMMRALAEYQIQGIKTTVPFFQRILRHPAFVAGKTTTHFIQNLGRERKKTLEEEKTVALIAAGIKSFSVGRSEFLTPKKPRMSHWKFQGRLQQFSNRL